MLSLIAAAILVVVPQVKTMTIGWSYRELKPTEVFEIGCYTNVITYISEDYKMTTNACKVYKPTINPNAIKVVDTTTNRIYTFPIDMSIQLDSQGRGENRAYYTVRVKDNQTGLVSQWCSN